MKTFSNLQLASRGREWDKGQSNLGEKSAKETPFSRPIFLFAPIEVLQRNEGEEPPLRDMLRLPDAWCDVTWAGESSGTID